MDNQTQEVVLTPQERKELREERRKAIERMSPEEKKMWHDEMHRSPKGN